MRDLVEEYRDQSLAEQGDSYLRNLRIAGTRRYATDQALGNMFWL